MPNKLPARIFLCGFMGTGKSTIGKALAQKSGRPFYDLDDEIEKQVQQPIPQIFKTKGEKKFRQLERDALANLLHIKTGVVALGGGALQNQGIVDKLKSNGVLVFIKTPLHRILQRVLENNQRPMLWDENEKVKLKEKLRQDLKELYEQRLPFYRQAHLTIANDEFHTVEEISHQLYKKIIDHAKKH
jgi:shikimate kinase